MSQYPSPYTPPPAYSGYNYPYQAQDPYAALMAPARRAGVLMLIMGGLVLLCGGCLLMAAFIKLPAEQIEQIQRMNPDAQWPQPVEFITLAVIMGLPAIILLVLGMWVRRGTKAPVIISLVLACIGCLGVALQLLSVLALAAQGRGGGSVIATAGCMVVVSGVLLGLLVTWLIQAVRAASQLAAAQAQYQAQYWQYLQQQQMYNQQMTPIHGVPEQQPAASMPPPGPAASPPPLPPPAEKPEERPHGPSTET